ncbi:MAG: TolC family protein [Spirochaetota bacterium]
MKNRRTPIHHARFVLAVVLLACGTFNTLAQEPPTGARSLEEVVRLAVAHDAELLRLRRTVDDALEKLGWPGQTDDVTLRVDGTLFGNDFASMGTDAGASLSAGLQILPQLGISGTLAANYDEPQTPQSPDPLVASVQLTLRPLADTHGRARDELALERAQAALAERARAVSLEAIRALFDLLEAEDALVIGGLDVEIAAHRETTTRALAARGRATDDEVRAAADEHRLARQGRSRRRLAAEQARWFLGARTGVPAEAFTPPDWEALELGEAVRRIAAASEETDVDQLAPAAHRVLIAGFDLRAAGIEAAATLPFAPQIAATAGVSYPGPGYSLGFSLSARLSDLDSAAARRANEDVRLAELALDSATNAAEYAARAALLDLEIALENARVATRDVALAEVDLTEAEFRLARGDVTEITVARAQRDLEHARSVERTAQGAVVKAWYRVDLLQF